jgi:hypothetical protein
MKQQSEKKASKPQSSKHWVLWTLVVLFIVGSITVMMLADYLFAPGSGDRISEPKDAAEK